MYVTVLNTESKVLGKVEIQAAEWPILHHRYSQKLLSIERTIELRMKKPG